MNSRYYFLVLLFSAVTNAREHNKTEGILKLIIIVYESLFFDFQFYIIACAPRDCKELYEQGHTCSGVYTIKPDELPAFEVKNLTTSLDLTLVHTVI